MNDSLDKSFMASLGESSGTAISNILEVGLDVLIVDNSILKDVPFLSTVIEVFKMERTLFEMYHVRQLARFIEEINKGIVDSKKIEKYKTKFENKSVKEKNKELEYIVLITSKYLDENKPRWLARLFMAYIDEKIDWKYFISYSEIIDRFLPGDMDTLMFGDYKDIQDEERTDSLIRLSSLGLYSTLSKPVSALNTPGHIMIPSSDIKDYLLTDFGKKMLNCLNFSREEETKNIIDSLEKGRGNE